MKLDRFFDPVRAQKWVHRGGLVTEKLKPIQCDGCKMRDYVWAPVEPPDAGATWVWKCPTCHSLIGLKSESRPAEGPAMLGDWEPFMHPNMGHEPVLIKSRKHFVEEAKARGLRTKWM